MDFYPSVGGVSNYWISLSEHLDPAYWIVLAPSLARGAREHSCRYKIIRKKFFSHWCIPKWLPLLFSIYRILRSEKIDQIVVGQTLPVGTAVAILSAITRIPYLVSTHGMDIALALRHRRKRAVCRWVLSRAKGIFTISAYTARIIAKYGIAGDKISFIQPCPRITPAMLIQSAQNTDHATRSPIILTVARLVRRKGHEYILSSLPDSISSYPNLIYAIIGEGPERADLERRVRELGVERSVVFLGLLSDAHTAWWYAHADVFVMTPIDIDGDVEGFGIVYLESNGFGKPVIASSSGGIPDAVRDGVTGLIVPEKSSEAIRSALLTLLGDPALATRFGSQGKKRVEEEFLWSVQAKKLILLLER